MCSWEGCVGEGWSGKSTISYTQSGIIFLIDGKSILIRKGYNIADYAL